jgi:hypothetical protein
MLIISSLLLLLFQKPSNSKKEELFQLALIFFNGSIYTFNVFTDKWKIQKIQFDFQRQTEKIEEYEICQIALNLCLITEP